MITGLILLINGLNFGIRFIARNIENALPCLALLWRQRLSERLLGDYLRSGAYSRLGSPAPEPPEVAAAANDGTVAASIRVTVEVIDALLTFVSFLAVLWSLSARLAVMLLLYASFGTGLVLFYGLVHIRDNAEAIAFYRGEDQEQRQAQRQLDGVIRNADGLVFGRRLFR